MYLFIDTTEKITLGLIDKNFKWIEYINEDLNSISSLIHKYIFDLLEKHSTDINKISGLIYCAGPGSYTGMRVSEGLASILHWQGLKTYTFYHYEIPWLCNIREGQWISKAFKQEFFVYNWNGEKSSYKLVKEGKFDLDPAKTTYCKNSSFVILGLKYTDDLLKNHPEIIFEKIIRRDKIDEIFYYRALEAEFSKQ